MTKKERLDIQSGLIQDMSEALQAQSICIAGQSEQLKELKAMYKSLERDVVDICELIQFERDDQVETRDTPPEFFVKLTAPELRALRTGHRFAWQEGYIYYDSLKDTCYRGVDHEELQEKLRLPVSKGGSTVIDVRARRGGEL